MTGVAADAMTDRAIVVAQDRPVIPYGGGLREALRAAAESGRELQLVTPPGARLTMPLRLMLSAPNCRWIVRGDGFYDGLTGAPLRWDGGAFVVAPGATDYAPGFLERPFAPLGSRLTLTFRVRYPDPRLTGGAADRLCALLTGAPIAAWGDVEPAGNPWPPEGDLPQRIVVSAPPRLLGVLGHERDPAGWVESSTLVVGYEPDAEPPVAGLPDMVEAVAGDHELLFLSAQLSPGPADLTTEPRWSGSPAPIGLAAAAVVGGGTPVPPELPVRPLGKVWWYELGDGRSAEGWQRYRLLNRYLRA
jgi:hypothetical protein